MGTKLSDNKGKADGEPMGAGEPEKDLTGKSKKGKRPVEILVGIGTLCFIMAIGLLLTGDLREYLRAKRLFNAEDYEQAAIIFKELADYREADNLYNESVYSVGKNQFEKGHYVTAIDTLSTISNDEKARKLLEQVKYEYGSLLAEQKNYQEAVIFLEDIQRLDSAGLYEKSLSLSTSNIYNGLFYITPAQVKSQVESALAENGAAWKLTEITRSEDSNTLHYYILDEEGKALDAYISFFDYDEEEETISSMAFSYDHEKVIGDELAYIISGMIGISDPALSDEDAQNIQNELQLQLQSVGSGTNQILTYDSNHIEYILNYNSKTSIYMLTPIQSNTP